MLAALSLSNIFDIIVSARYDGPEGRERERKREPSGKRVSPDFHSIRNVCRRFSVISLPIVRVADSLEFHGSIVDVRFTVSFFTQRLLSPR